jgi:hypothetical protein
MLSLVCIDAIIPEKSRDIKLFVQYTFRMVLRDFLYLLTV